MSLDADWGYIYSEDECIEIPEGLRIFGYKCWIYYQAAHKRAFYKKGKLSDDKIKKLEQIPKWFWKKR